MNKKRKTDTIIYNLEPGDATKYTFALTEVPYAVISGCTLHPEKYVIVTILMGETGVATLLRSDLAEFSENHAGHVVGYAKSHGLGNINDYTLRAILAAAGVLCQYSTKTDRACKRMMEANGGDS